MWITWEFMKFCIVMFIFMKFCMTVFIFIIWNYIYSKTRINYLYFRINCINIIKPILKSNSINDYQISILYSLYISNWWLPIMWFNSLWNKYRDIYFVTTNFFCKFIEWIKWCNGNNPWLTLCIFNDCWSTRVPYSKR